MQTDVAAQIQEIERWPDNPALDVWYKTEEKRWTATLTFKQGFGEKLESVESTCSEAVLQVKQKGIRYLLEKKSREGTH